MLLSFQVKDVKVCSGDHLTFKWVVHASNAWINQKLYNALVIKGDSRKKSSFLFSYIYILIYIGLSHLYTNVLFIKGVYLRSLDDNLTGIIYIDNVQRMLCMIIV